jgi:YCII-related domain
MTLIVIPVILGQGARLFPETGPDLALDVVESRVDSKGVTIQRGEQAVFSDGPFVESKEYLAGIWVWEAPDLDVALKLATEASKVCDRKSRCGRSSERPRGGGHPGPPRRVGAGGHRPAPARR